VPPSDAAHAGGGFTARERGSASGHYNSPTAALPRIVDSSPQENLGVAGMGIENLSDESPFRLYENIREQVAADLRLGSRHRLLRETESRKPSVSAQNWTAAG
jgi:hypothetical protein